MRITHPEGGAVNSAPSRSGPTVAGVIVLAAFPGLPLGVIVAISVLVPVAIVIPIALKASNAHEEEPSDALEQVGVGPASMRPGRDILRFRASRAV